MSHTWLLKHGQYTFGTDFKFYLTLINLNCHIGIVATISGSEALNSHHSLISDRDTFDGNYPLIRMK